ncbi:uncharacterized protein LOC125032014 [Penaeus chinensis]|uniref:uncharacterized protein LOC125032014 n=1 Tax=Penaeus chinensis TaxID=139456 RepID=UPI001FB6742C|nr:uncharacterized protein LOC125032014 [Penaeus chinensis]
MVQVDKLNSTVRNRVGLGFPALAMSDKKYTQHYKTVTDSRFKGWLQPFPGDSTKARCKVCGTSLQAHLKTILGHDETKRHIENIKPSGSKVQSSIKDSFKLAENDPTKVAELKLAVMIKFPNLSSLALSLLSLPYSNASIERIFSQMNVVHSKLRNRLSVRSVEAILQIRFGLKLQSLNCSTFVPSNEIIRNFGAKDSAEEANDDIISIDTD